MTTTKLTSHISHRSQSQPSLTLLERLAALKLKLLLAVDPEDVVERAAILEFSGGFSRDEANTIALAEAGFPSWNAIVAAQRVDKDPLS